MIKDHNDFRSGPLRKGEWGGFWKAQTGDDIMTFDEWSGAWTSLRSWLRKRLVVDWIPRRGRQVYVVDTYDYPERTLYISISDVSVLTRDFLEYVLEWLKSGWSSWRVEVITDDSDENAVMIYPDAIRINEAAEQDLDAFLDRMRPRIQQANERAARDLGGEWRGWVPDRA